MKKVCHLGVLLSLVLLATGCGHQPTQDERDNRRVMDAILTAITLKNTRLLDENAKRVEDRHTAGQLTDEEFNGMKAVIEKAHKGDWAGAERDGYDFRKVHPFVPNGQ